MCFQIFLGMETFSSHKVTFTLKRTCVPDLVKKSERTKKKKESKKQMLMKLFRKKDVLSIKEQAVQDSHMEVEPFHFFFGNNSRTRCHFLCFLFVIVV